MQGHSRVQQTVGTMSASRLLWWQLLGRGADQLEQPAVATACQYILHTDHAQVPAECTKLPACSTS